jgi:carboxyl-terminal processing protease
MRSRPTLSSRLLPLLQALFVLLLVITTAQVNWAQPKIRLPSSVQTADPQNLLAEGKRLEALQQWTAARDHYRKAHKQYPDRTDIEARIKSTGIHSNLARRYHDTSFLASLNSDHIDQAQNGLAEVLLKIQTHHFQEPNWQAIARQGIEHLEIALSDPLFLKHHQVDASSAATKRFLDASRKLVTGHAMTRRLDLLKTIMQIARDGRGSIQLPMTATVMEFTCGVAASLDKYSSYLTPHQLDEIFSQIEGNFVGLGIELKTSTDRLKVIRVIAGGPANEGGIEPGDSILAVDGRTIPEITPDEAADLLRGSDGSQVRVTIARSGNPDWTISMKRRRVDVPSIEGVRIIDSTAGIGYLRITCFQKTTSHDLDDALWQLHRQGMKSLVIDIRNNPGGLLIGAVKVADRFLDQGTIVQTRGRSSSEDIDYKAHQLGTWSLPIVVLINDNSASASEIFAGAIRDRQRGSVVGITSYGKGSVQGIFPLSSTTAGLRLTTARFYSPSGQAISNNGVTPDVLVHTVGRPVPQGTNALSGSYDPILDAGLDVLRDGTPKP